MKTIKLFAISLLLYSFNAYSLNLDFLKKPRRPPPAAVFACEESAADDECSFEINDVTLHGSCFTPDENFPLACRPNKEDMQLIPREDN